MKARSMVGRLALAIALVVAAGGCRRAAIGEKEVPAVKVAVVDRLAGGTGTRYSAQIEPATRVDMAFKVGGYVESIAKTTGVDGKPRILQEGDSVRESQELAALRKTEYVQKLEEARADSAQAKASVEQARRDLARAETLVKSGSVGNIELENARTKLDSVLASAAGANAREEQAATSLSARSFSTTSGRGCRRTLKPLFMRMSRKPRRREKERSREPCGAGQRGAEERLRGHPVGQSAGNDLS